MLPKREQAGPDQNLVSYESGQDTSAYQISGHSSTHTHEND